MTSHYPEDAETLADRLAADIESKAAGGGLHQRRDRPPAHAAVAAHGYSIGESTVKTHLLRVFGKLGVDDRTAAVTSAMRFGLLE